MAARIQALLAELAGSLNSLPGVFSTAQWGGRAYKVPRGSGGASKPKLLAHVSIAEGGQVITASFKLTTPRAEEAIDRYDWIEPHSFRTLAPAGWLTATVTTKRQLGVLVKLIRESHTLLGPPPPAVDVEVPSRTRRPSNGAAGRIDEVMKEVAGEGWAPKSDW